MDPKATQEWTSSEEEEFKALFTQLWYEKSCDEMEVLAKRFPAKSIHQLGKKYIVALEDMLCGATDDEPSRDDTTTDWHDWYKLLQRDPNDLVLEPLVERPLSEPSEQLLFKPEDHVEIQESHSKSSRKRKQSWTCEEHRQFLNGVNCLGRGSWKLISEYFVPSRTPIQLASHAQKYFDRIKKNEMDDTRQRHSINDIRFVGHSTNITAHSSTEVGKGKGIASSVPPPILTENIDILHGLSQGMTKFGQASDSPSKLIGHMTHNNQIASSIPPSILTEVIDIMHGQPQGMPEFGQVSNSPSNLIGQMTHNNQSASRTLILTKDKDILHSLAQGMHEFGQGSSSPRNLAGYMIHDNQIGSSILSPIMIDDMDILQGLAQGMPEFGQESNSPSNLAGHMTHDNEIASSIPSPIIIDDMDIMHGLAQGIPKFGQASSSPSNLAGQMIHNNQIASSIPPPILIEDINILNSLLQGMPEFEQASDSPSNIAAGQMTHNNHIMESVQQEVSRTPSPKENVSVLLDQTSAENRARSSRKRTIGATTNMRHKNNKTIPPGVLTAQRNPPSYEIVPIKRHNLQQIVPPF